MLRRRRGARDPAIALLLGVAICAAGGLGGCSNNPYPGADDGVKVRYRALPDPPKTLDPAVSYTTLEHKIMASVYEPLLEYHYLERPYRLIPGLATEVPEARPLEDGRVAYRFRLREGVLYQDDTAFALGGEGDSTRTVEAADIAFQLTRHADPEVESRVIATFARIEGFEAFSERLTKLREEEPGFAELRIDRQYAGAGGIDGIRVLGPTELEVVLAKPYPQFIYWFAMHFTAPVPWEAVAYYDGEQGRPFFKDHPVGAGPYKITRYDKRSRIVLDRNENWYGSLHPEWRAPAATYPETGMPGDREAGLLDPAYAGKPLPFLDRIEFRVEKEDIPTFNKFLQGYYDASGVIQESFDQVVHEGGLSDAMRERGMKLDKAVNPDIFYIGFNMSDPVVGSAAGERGRKLRQAMSLAVDAQEFARLFLNGRGVPAQSPVPPGIFGYEEGYVNPFRETDLARARERLAEAGYPDGIDPETGKPLHLSFDIGDTSTRGRLRYQFFVNAWNRMGLDVDLAATNYNKFQEKVREGAYQVFIWGWVADYPDPENFLFLLTGPMAVAASGGPNTANFQNDRFDELFVAMKDLPNGPERLELIREMRDIVVRERPWIELYHRESYALFHGWMKNVKTAGLSFPVAKYHDIDPELRARRREEWNRPIVWPAWTLAALVLAVTAPGVATYLRERQ